MPYRHCATRAGNYLQTTARDSHSPYSRENLRERESSLSADSPFIPARYFGISKTAGSIVLFNSTFFTAMVRVNCPPISRSIA